MVKFADSFFDTGTALSLGEVEDGIVGADVSITSTEASAITGIGSSHRIGVFGKVAAGISAIEIDAGFSTRISVGRSGSLLAHGHGIDVVGDDTRIVNHGDITSVLGSGINLALVAEGAGPPAPGLVPFGYVIRNLGTITGETAIRATGAKLTLSNWGELTALGDIAISTGLDADSLRNFGTITGDVQLGDGANTLINRGTIDGKVTLGSGSDFLDNRDGTITGQVSLGAGTDTYRPGAGNETVSGGANKDTLDFSASGAFRLALDGSFEASGAALGDSFTGFETVIGSQSGSDTIRGTNTSETISGLGGDDTLFGGGGDDLIYGDAGNNFLYGENGKDNILGGNGNDFLSGGAGSDYLTGYEGNDVLVGGDDYDYLTGGTGADRFVWINPLFKKFTDADNVTDFSRGEGDKLDLSKVDAIFVKGNIGDQAFTFIGTDAFTKVAGQLRYDKGTISPYDFVELKGDVDGDGVADFTITVFKTTELFASDIIL